MTTPSAAELRAWARENGHMVASRGRVPNDVRSAWQSAHTPRRKRRPAPLPVGSGASALTEPDHSSSADEEKTAAAVMAEQLAALTERVDRLETRLASRSKKKRKKKER